MFAEVLLPLPLHVAFTYSVPPEMEASIARGHRVVVPFGTRKFYTGIVTNLTQTAPDPKFQTKAIAQLLDNKPIVRAGQVDFWQWIADYYLCSVGEVYKAAVPAGLKLESETCVMLEESFLETESPVQLSPEELRLVMILEHKEKPVAVAELLKTSGIEALPKVLESLLSKGAIRVKEELQQRYHTRKEAMVRVAFARGDNEALRRAFDAVGTAPKQQAALLALLDMSGFMQPADQPVREVAKKSLLERAQVSAAILDALRQKELVEPYTRQVSRFAVVDHPAGSLPQLSEAQHTALRAIHESFIENPVTLLHGVTASGKTEIYIHLIDYVLRQGRQVLYMVPEIALTTQLTERLQRVFGGKVVIYHSKFSDAERVEIWRRLLDSREPCVVIGARSSVFLPFASLGLVIVDEEHESSYKQQDPAPRYNGRDASLVLARRHGAKALLGSATPAIDTYWKALQGRYGLVELSTRFSEAPLPEIRLIDMKRERLRKAVDGIMSETLINLTRAAVDNGRQAILFLNRRGFAPLARCKACAYTPKCDDCDVSLTYHRRLGKLVCHYCGAVYDLPKLCPSCHEPAMEVLGYGTERVEDNVADIFPDTPLARLDLDTTRNKDAYAQIIDRFSQGKAKILIGTQMVTKGLDFDSVSVVGVVNADALIHFPDFRSSERAFNMLEQVAGRAGRRSDTPGLVAIQTYSPDHPLFDFLKHHDYRGFYNHEITERKQFNYPPFTRLIYIYIRHKDAGRVNAIASEYGVRLRALFGNRVAGPDEPSVGRIQTWFIRRLMLKIEVGASMQKVKEYLRTLYEQMGAEHLLSGAMIHYDVDPI